MTLLVDIITCKCIIIYIIIDVCYSMSMYMYVSINEYSYYYIQNKYALMLHLLKRVLIILFIFNFKGTDQAGTFMSLKYVVYYANYRSWHQSSKIQVVS